MRRLLALLLLVFTAPAQAETSLPWAKWDPSLFDRAAREDRYILLHMAAVWCHWCHVMERTTYRDPAIQQRIAEKFIAVRVDQDSDPALSYRYESWGWPATIMLDKDGNEIFKRRGYLPPELFGKLLAAVIEDPSALATYTAGATVDRTYPTRYFRIEWFDRREGPLPAADVDYPELPEAAAFACANGACSIPVFTPDEVHRIAAKVDDR